MTYTRPWSDSVPLGTLDADEIDDAMRDFRLDIHERCNTIMGADGDFANDPAIPYSMTTMHASITALNTATGAVTTGERMIPWYEGKIIATAGTVTQTQQYVDLTGASASLTLLVPMTLPVGVTLTGFRARVLFQNSGHTVSATFKGTTDESDAYTFALTPPGSISGSPQWIAPSVSLTHVTLTQTAYGFIVTIANNNLATTTPVRFYGCQVFFTSPGAGVR